MWEGLSYDLAKQIFDELSFEELYDKRDVNVLFYYEWSKRCNKRFKKTFVVNQKVVAMNSYETNILDVVDFDIKQSKNRWRVSQEIWKTIYINPKSELFYITGYESEKIILGEWHRKDEFERYILFLRLKSILKY